MNVKATREMQAADLELLVKKNHDYGSANIEITGVYGVAVRLQDKVSRLLNLTRGDKTAAVKGESLEDTFRDISNYGLIGRLLMAGQFGEESQAVDQEEYLAQYQPDNVRMAESYPEAKQVDFAGMDNGPVIVGTRESEEFDFEIREVTLEKSSKPTNMVHRPYPMVYLAGPMDLVTTAQATLWRTEAEAFLTSRGFSIFNPTTAMGGGDYSRRAAMGICRAAIDHSSYLLANLPEGQVAFGTIREIEYAAARIPVFVASDWVHRSTFSDDLLVFDQLHTAMRGLVAYHAAKESHDGRSCT